VLSGDPQTTGIHPWGYPPPKGLKATAISYTTHKKIKQKEDRKKNLTL